MLALYRNLKQTLFILAFFGWLTYPGWLNDWYSVSGENYAYPASFSNSKDPQWGFWFW
jgi:hypothetical protein